MIVNGKRLTFCRANKPNDYFYFNLKIPDSQQFKNILYSWAVLGMELVLSFLILMIMQLWQLSSRDQSAGFFEAHFPVMCMSIVTNVLNFILSYSMDLLSSKL